MLFFFKIMHETNLLIQIPVNTYYTKHFLLLED